MYLIGLLVLIIALTLAVILFIFIKTPRLTPKKVITEIILSAHNDLFPYRQEVQSLLCDSLAVYQQRESGALNTRYSTADRHFDSIEQKLSSAETTLAPYEKVKSQQQFYENASATIGTLRQIMGDIQELQYDSASLETVITNLHRVNIMTQDTIVSTYVSADEPQTVQRVEDHVAATIALIKNTRSQLSTLSVQSNEFQRVATSIHTVLEQLEQQWHDLQQLLATRQYDLYRSSSLSIPTLLSQFDISSYTSIVIASFSSTPEEFLINDLRAHLYS